MSSEIQNNFFYKFSGGNEKVKLALNAWQFSNYKLSQTNQYYLFGNEYLPRLWQREHTLNWFSAKREQNDKIQTKCFMQLHHLGFYINEQLDFILSLNRFLSRFNVAWNIKSDTVKIWLKSTCKQPEDKFHKSQWSFFFFLLKYG